MMEVQEQETILVEGPKTAQELADGLMELRALGVREISTQLLRKMANDDMIIEALSIYKQMLSMEAAVIPA